MLLCIIVGYLHFYLYLSLILLYFSFLQKINKKDILAVFDFDGTITYKDSFLLFVLYSVGFINLLWSTISKSQYFIIFCKNDFKSFLKEKFINYFFHNMSDDIFQFMIENFIENKLPKLINPKAFQCMMQHMEQGHRVIVISANIEDLVGKWCDKYGISEYSCTNLLKKDGNLTGRINGANCYGIEKVKRLISLVGTLDKFIIYAYGDSKGDSELLEIADHSFYKFFPKLK